MVSGYGLWVLNYNENAYRYFKLIDVIVTC